MARLTRVVVPGLPYHVTHGWNRRARVFFEEEDREAYLAHLERFRPAARAGGLELVSDGQSCPSAGRTGAHGLHGPGNGECSRQVCAGKLGDGPFKSSG